MQEKIIREKLKPFMLVSDPAPSDVRKHSLAASEELAALIRPHIKKPENTLFVFPMRGSMLLYPAFADRFDSSSFCFVFYDRRTDTVLSEFDTVVTVDTIINSGKTVFTAKELLDMTGIKAKKLFSASVCANSALKEKLNENFDKVFSLCYIDYLRELVDMGQFAVCGDGMILEKRHILK